MATVADRILSRSVVFSCLTLLDLDSSFVLCLIDVIFDLSRFRFGVLLVVRAKDGSFTLF